MVPKNKNSRRYGFWTVLQLFSLGAILASIVLCFIISWWFILLAFISLIINGIAYKKRMLSLGKDPSTRDIDDVV